MIFYTNQDQKKREKADVEFKKSISTNIVSTQKKKKKNDSNHFLAVSWRYYDHFVCFIKSTAFLMIVLPLLQLFQFMSVRLLHWLYLTRYACGVVVVFGLKVPTVDSAVKILRSRTNCVVCEKIISQWFFFFAFSITVRANCARQFSFFADRAAH